MVIKLYIFISAIFSLFLIIPSSVSASLGDMSLRTELGSLEDVKQDKTFNETALISGRCRDVGEDLTTLTTTKWMYRHKNKNDANSKVKQVGAYYIDEHGRKCVCFDEFGLTSFIEKNIHGDRVDIIGVLAPGISHNLEHNEIIMIKSLELKNVMPN